MKIKSIKAFSIIEILVWIFIFSIWLVSIYAVIISTLRLNDYNSNYIVATNLAKEQLELIRNIRDSNYRLLKPYNLKNPDSNTFNLNDKFEEWHYYKIENNFWNNFPIIVSDISTWFQVWKEHLNSNSMQSYILCLNWDNVYTHDCSWDNKKTVYYRYFYIDKLEDKNWIINNAFKVSSKVVWYKRWYHEYEIDSIIADWIRL